MKRTYTRDVQRTAKWKREDERERERGRQFWSFGKVGDQQKLRGKQNKCERWTTIYIVKMMNMMKGLIAEVRK